MGKPRTTGEIVITIQDKTLKSLRAQMALFDAQVKKASGELLFYMQDRVETEMHLRAVGGNNELPK